MNFRVEKVDQKKGNEIRPLLGRILPYRLGDLVLIDDERSILFISTGGQGYLPRGRGDCSTGYCMVLEEFPIYFNGYDTVQKVGDVMTAFIELDTFLVPHSYLERSDFIQELIIEAFTVYWRQRFGDHMTVSISFPKVGVVVGPKA